MKILIASPIYSEAIETLKETHDVICAFNAKEDELKAKIGDREALIFRSGVQITADVMRCAPNLKLLVRAGSGLDNLDLNYVRENDLKLVRVPEPGAKAVAELTFTFMLALSRQLLEADCLLRKGRWAKYDLTGYLITGKTLGIIGAGNIGSLVGKMGAAWGMNVIGCVETPTAEHQANLEDKGIRLTNIEEVLTTADYVSLHVPLNNRTRNFINKEKLSMMKPGSFLINLARGGVVDEEALHCELTTEGRLAGAALDVHKEEGEGKISPLANLRNVILTPHIGAMTIDSQKEIGDRVIETVENFKVENFKKEVTY